MTLGMTIPDKMDLLATLSTTTLNKTIVSIKCHAECCIILLLSLVAPNADNGNSECRYAEGRECLQSHFSQLC